MTIDTERNLPADFEKMLPRAYDRRQVPRPGVIVDRRGADRKFAAELRTMRERIAAAASEATR
jgi:hypothetical protein